jgi:pimeloyl-ACP methyl ester carboxylesterase
MAEFSIERDGVALSGEDGGDGPPVVLLHGLTATRRYVVMGSTALERSGHRVVTYDARAHGRSTPAADPGDYRYGDLGGDALAVIDALGIDRPVFAGASMGAHTLLWLALHAPERVGGLVVITPSYDRAALEDPGRLAHWDALADGLRRGGVEGFIEAYGEPRVPAKWRDTVLKVIRQRLSLHEHPDGLADALQAVPRSVLFEDISELAAIDVPVAVVASADEADPEHPQAVGEAYAAAIPAARLVLDEPGRSPVAWQGSQLSKIIAELAGRAGGG